MTDVSVYKYLPTPRIVIQDNTSAAIATAAYVACAVNITESNTLDYKNANVIVALTMAAAITKGNKVHIFMRNRELVGSTDHEPAPSSNFPYSRKQSFQPDIVTTEQFLIVPVYNIPRKFTVYLENGTDQIVNAAWRAWLEPFSTGSNP